MISFGNLSNGFETILKLEMSIVNLRKIMTKSSMCTLVVSCQRGSKILNVCTELTFEISYLDNEIPN